jgi:hypothetical protein
MDITHLEQLISFEDKFEIVGRGIVYCGKLKRMAWREEILNTDIILFNDLSYKITGVEAPCIPDPLREGLLIGLLMVEIKIP